MGQVLAEVAHAVREARVGEELEEVRPEDCVHIGDGGGEEREDTLGGGAKLGVGGCVKGLFGLVGVGGKCFVQEGALLKEELDEELTAFEVKVAVVGHGNDYLDEGLFDLEEK